MTTQDSDVQEHTDVDEQDQAILPYSASLQLDRAAGALLPRGSSSDQLPEALLHQLQDPAVLEDTPIYWFRAIGSNGAEDHYGTIMQTDSLRNYAKDAQAGLPFCNAHRMDELPFGRTFDGAFHQQRGSNLARTSMDVYMPVDMNVNGVDTSHFIKGSRSGVIRDVSIKFQPGHIQCSIDNRNMPKNIWELLFSDPDDPDAPCRHIPGVTYKVDGKKVRARGRVFGAHCLHLSPVWKGATPGAQIINSRALVVDERAAPPDWVLDTPTVRMAAMLADAELLDRDTAIALEDCVRGISFPTLTAQRFAGVDLERARGKKKGNPFKPPSDDNPDPDNDGDDDRTPEGDTDNSHWTKDGKKKKDKWVDHTKRDQETSEDEESEDMTGAAEGREQTREAGTSRQPASAADESSATRQQTAQTSAEAGGERQAEEEELPPAVTRSDDERAASAGAERHEEPTWHADLRAVMLEAGLAPEGFDGDPLTQLRTVGRQFEVEKRWGGWGRRYRQQLCEDIEREGVRAFGGQAWADAKAAYEGTLKRGDADELVALRKHFEAEAARRLQGGRATRDDEQPPSATERTNGRPRIPAAAYRS